MSKPGIETFNIFLNVIDVQNMIFLKGDYLNHPECLIFFKTDRIKNIAKILDQIEFRKSLLGLHAILKTIKDKSLSFFFSINEKLILEYGVLELNSKSIYIFGEFKIQDGYLNSLSNKCITPIRLDLTNLNIKQLSILHTVKKDFKTIFDTESEPRILDTRRIAVSFDLNDFNPADLEKERIDFTLRDFADKKKWGKKVETYVTIDDKVNFFIKVKEKNITLYEISSFDEFIDLNEKTTPEEITEIKTKIISIVNSNTEQAPIILKKIYDIIETLDLTDDEKEHTENNIELSLELIELELGSDILIDIFNSIK